MGAKRVEFRFEFAGNPGFVVDGELFWGNDRLEAAIEHAAA